MVKKSKLTLGLLLSLFVLSPTFAVAWECKFYELTNRGSNSNYADGLECYTEHSKDAKKEKADIENQKQYTCAKQKMEGLGLGGNSKVLGPLFEQKGSVWRTTVTLWTFVNKTTAPKDQLKSKLDAECR